MINNRIYRDLSEHLNPEDWRGGKRCVRGFLCRQVGMARLSHLAPYLDPPKNAGTCGGEVLAGPGSAQQWHALPPETFQDICMFERCGVVGAETPTTYRWPDSFSLLSSSDHGRGCHFFLDRLHVPKHAPYV